MLRHVCLSLFGWLEDRITLEDNDERYLKLGNVVVASYYNNFSSSILKYPTPWGTIISIRRFVLPIDLESLFELTYAYRSTYIFYNESKVTNVLVTMNLCTKFLFGTKTNTIEN